MNEKTTTARRLTDEQAIRIGVADILLLLSKDESTAEQKQVARGLIEQAVNALGEKTSVVAA